MRTGRENRPTDLFLVRISIRNPRDGSNRGDDSIKLHGKVQRTVDGETHAFHDGQSLLHWLTVMLEVQQVEEEGR